MNFVDLGGILRSANPHQAKSHTSLLSQYLVYFERKENSNE